MKNGLRKFLLVSVMVVFMVSGSNFLLGENDNGFYLSLNGSYVYITGSDFNGDVMFYSDEEFLIVPKIEANLSYGFAIGSRASKIAYELRYERAPLSGSFLGLNYDSTINLVSLVIKRFFSTRSSWQPHFTFGIGYSWFVIKNGSETLLTPLQIGNATYTGFNLDIGFGLSYFVFPQLSIDIGVLGRFLMYSSGKGVTDYRYDLDESLFGYGAVGIFGLTYIF